MMKAKKITRLVSLILVICLCLGISVYAGEDTNDGSQTIEGWEESYSAEQGIAVSSAGEYTDVVPAGDGSWWFVRNGQVDYWFTGIAANAYGYWYCVNGQVDFGAEGLAYGVVAGIEGWWYIRGGQVTFIDTVAANEAGWWCVHNGQVDFGYTGIAANEYGYWYCVNGQVDFSFTGIAGNEYGFWYFTNGQLDFGYTGLVQNEYGCWYCVNGQVDFGAEGLAYGTVNGITDWWYVQGGQVAFIDTVAANEAGWWCVHNGRVDFGFTGIAGNAYGFWYCVNGQVDFSFSGIVNNEYGTWYCQGGQVALNYTGPVTIDGVNYDVVNGMAAPVAPPVDPSEGYKYAYSVILNQIEPHARLLESFRRGKDINLGNVIIADIVGDAAPEMIYAVLRDETGSVSVGMRNKFDYTRVSEIHIATYDSSTGRAYDVWQHDALVFNDKGGNASFMYPKSYYTIDDARNIYCVTQGNMSGLVKIITEYQMNRVTGACDYKSDYNYEGWNMPDPANVPNNYIYKAISTRIKPLLPGVYLLFDESFHSDYSSVSYDDALTFLSTNP